MTSNALYSSASDDWPTPQDFYDRLDAEFGFVVDACSSTTNHKAELFYALDHLDHERRDGLAGDWAADAHAAGGSVWMNPPYGRTIADWMRKAHATARSGATVACLVPVRASSGWWHDLVLITGAEVRYVRGRLTFGTAKTSAPFASAVVIYRPTDTPGVPGPVGIMSAKATAPRTQVGHAGADPKKDVSAYIAGYTPRTLDADAWALAGDPVRTLVRLAKPHSVAQARLSLSHLVGYLADPATWDRAAAPDLTELLERSRINAHVTRTTFRAARTQATRRDTLYRLGRAAGVIDPAIARPKGDRRTPDSFLLAGATLPLPVAHLHAARQMLPNPNVEALQVVGEAVTCATRKANAHGADVVTVTPWATIRTLTEAPNQGLTVTNQTPGSDAAASNTPAIAARPASRRGRLAAAKAKQAAAVAQASTSAARLTVPDGSDLTPAIVARVHAFAPQKKVRQAWTNNAALGAGLVFAYRPGSPRQAQNLCSHVALFLTWMDHRPDRKPGTPLDVTELLVPGLVDAWIDEVHWSGPSKATARSALRRIIRNLDPSAAHLRLEHHKTSAPYTPAEADWFARAAWHQPTTALTRDLCLIIGLGLGAGLDARDLRHLTRDAFTEVPGAGTSNLFVSVPGAGPRSRSVPIRTAYVPLVKRGLDLHAQSGKSASTLLIGKVADRNNVVGPLRNRSKTAEGERLEVRMSRLRNTWLVAQMCARVSLADLLPVAGLGSARTVTELLPYCPEPSPQERDQLIAVLAGAR